MAQTTEIKVSVVDTHEIAALLTEAFEDGRFLGEGDGFSKGWEEGREDGYELGCAVGYAEGWDAGREEMADGN